MDQVPSVGLSLEFRRQFGGDQVNPGARAPQVGDLARGDRAATHDQAGLIADIKKDG
jgi:hypothetical protein